MGNVLSNLHYYLVRIILIIIFLIHPTLLLTPKYPPYLRLTHTPIHGTPLLRSRRVYTNFPTNCPAIFVPQLRWRNGSCMDYTDRKEKWDKPAACTNDIRHRNSTNTQPTLATETCTSYTLKIYTCAPQTAISNWQRAAVCLIFLSGRCNFFKMFFN